MAKWKVYIDGVRWTLSSPAAGGLPMSCKHYQPLSLWPRAEKDVYTKEETGTSFFDPNAKEEFNISYWL